MTNETYISYARDYKITRLAVFVKRLLYPGLDLNTRCRLRFLPPFFRSGDIETLDAGFGNGAFAHAAYKKGNSVLGVTIWQHELDRTQALFNFMKIPDERVQLKVMNIYDLRSLNRQFDQIICLETLEHIARDSEVVQMFADLLRPNGRLILCCPNAMHPHHNLGRTDEPETGYHVRDGYTLESYEALLKPAGLRIVKSVGLGSPWLIRLDGILRPIRGRLGEVLSVPFFLLMLPFTLLDYVNPPVPYSLAVIAEKPA
jgi:2-polyprenyl-3-methyl-5-hydroxy-6-metoxy-1,4-benzoquinol methylase